MDEMEFEEVNEEEANAWGKQLKFDFVFRISSKKKTNIKEVFKSVATFLAENHYKENLKKAFDGYFEPDSLRDVSETVTLRKRKVENRREHGGCCTVGCKC